KIRKARTDPDPLPESAEGLAERPEALNLVSIYAALEDIEIEQVIQEYQGQGFSTFKKALADLAVVRLGPVGSEMKRLTAEPGEIDRILADGADRAAHLSRPIVAEVREIMGFLDPN
ncbi:MAG TPA: tryptophan--tRNA ligase, partial [Gammaproteobacteria bacterium]|nr:tryptophan--tRNA ligase [Gammaproteobacteria bacterium]